MAAPACVGSFLWPGAEGMSWCVACPDLGCWGGVGGGAVLSAVSDCFIVTQDFRLAACFEHLQAQEA